MMGWVIVGTMVAPILMLSVLFTLVLLCGRDTDA